jgi:hypothetical protein
LELNPVGEFAGHEAAIRRRRQGSQLDGRVIPFEISFAMFCLRLISSLLAG